MSILTLDCLTIEQDHKETLRRARERKAEEDRAKIQTGFHMTISGTCGDLGADLFGEGDTPLFYTKGTRK